MKQDRISGAAEIEKKMVKRIRKFLGKKELFNECLSFISAYPSMASIWNIANFAFLYGKEAEHEFKKMDEANNRVVLKGKNAIRKDATIITHSRSSTVVRILKECKDKNIKVVCTESRPRYEGRKLAKELYNELDITLVADSAIFSFIEEADMILVGADAITGSGMVNKIGTSAISLYGKMVGKPVYVASSSYKTFPFVLTKDENTREIWKNAPDRVNIKNIYFDLTPLEWISYYITENGVSANKPEFKHEISEEIIKIRKILKNKRYCTLKWDHTL